MFTDEAIEPWRWSFRNGFAPALSTPALQALASALESNDEALIQWQTTDPLPLMMFNQMQVCAACAVAYAVWKGDGLTTVGEVEEAFVRSCVDCDRFLGESSGCRHFLNWFDDTPRAVVVPALLEEVRLALTNRRNQLQEAA